MCFEASSLLRRQARGKGGTWAVALGSPSAHSLLLTASRLKGGAKRRAAQDGV
jgi:hypothetical protein